jgi:rhodanese-related sulfurtransferase
MDLDFRSVALEVRVDRPPADALFVDIREPYEREAGYMPGSVHVPIDEVAEWIVGSPPRRPVVFVCLGGLRAAMVAGACAAIGMDARYLAGGLRAWVAAGHPLEPSSAELADHGRPG